VSFVAFFVVLLLLLGLLDALAFTEFLALRAVGARFRVGRTLEGGAAGYRAVGIRGRAVAGIALAERRRRFAALGAALFAGVVEVDELIFIRGDELLLGDEEDVRAVFGGIDEG
jgi:hypothetical protein